MKNVTKKQKDASCGISFKNSKLQLLGLVFLIGIVGCGTYRFVNGAASPWNGNTATDLVIVHVHFDGNAPWHLNGSVFDSDTVVFAGQRHSPGTWISKYPGLSGGGSQILQGNEVFHVKSMLYPFDYSWHRLPGPLVVRFYFNTGTVMDNGGGRNGYISSAKINTVAGRSYTFNINYSSGQLSIN